MKTHLSTLLLIGINSICMYAQEPAMPETVQQMIEQAAQEGDEEEAALLFENYEEYLEHPLDLNNADTATLRQFPLFTDFQVQSLLDYRRIYGALYSIHELSLIHGFNEQLTQQLSPFFIIQPVSTYKKDNLWQQLTGGKHLVMMRTARTIEARKGYINNGEEATEETDNKHYLGFPWSLYLRYRYTYHKKLQWGITATNGAGEPFFKGANPYGFDFYSAHFLLNNVSKHIRRIVVGDYHAQFGQGLVLWSSGGRKVTNVQGAKKQERGFTAHTGSDENRFFRGAALTSNFHDLTVSAFFSNKYIDATTDDSGFSTLQTSGLHNTNSTMANKHTLQETVAGGNVSWAWEKLKIGATGLWHCYGAENHREIKLYNYFELKENNNANFGIDFSFLWKRCSIFGETAISHNGGKAAVAGILLDLAYEFQLSAVYRNYAKNYQAVYAKGFGNNSKTANEEGCSIGLQWLAHSLLTISGYADIFSFPWLRYGVDAPSTGWSYQLQASWQVTPATAMLFQVNQSSKAANHDGFGATKTIIDKKQTSLRYGIRYELLPGLKMEERIEFCLSGNGNNTTGLSLYHNITHKIAGSGIDWSARLALFDTESWDTRIYAYENDATGAFSVPAYYSKGLRWYLNFHWRPWKPLDIWLRAAQTRYVDKESISNGAAVIEGGVQTDIKLQVRVQF